MRPTRVAIALAYAAVTLAAATACGACTYDFDRFEPSPDSANDAGAHGDTDANRDEHG